LTTVESVGPEVLPRDEMTSHASITQRVRRFGEYDQSPPPEWTDAPGASEANRLDGRGVTGGVEALVASVVRTWRVVRDFLDADGG
jgi:hypothetical protein